MVREEDVPSYLSSNQTSVVGRRVSFIRLLQSYVTRPENTVRWRWKVGDVAFWDNRATQHYALADYGDQPRHVQRVTIVGDDIPVSIDGKRSEAIKGDSSAYNRSLVTA